MDQDQVLLRRVGALRTRVRLLVAQQWACIGLTGAALAALVLVAATRFRWWTDAVDYIWALLLLGAAAGLLAGWTRRITPLVAAQIADERAGLKERLSTAVELAGRDDRPEIAAAQIADAARHARELRPARVLPWRPPPQWRWLAGAGALLGAALFLPGLPLFQSPQELLDRRAMTGEGKQIRVVAREMERKLAGTGDDGSEAIMRRVAREMKRLGKDMENGRISKKQALLKAADLQKELREAESRLGGGPGRKSMERVAGDLVETAARRDRQGGGEGSQALRRMAENLEKRDFEGAQRQLEELAKKLRAGEMSPREAADAAETLEQMAQAMQGSALDQAAQQMRGAAKEIRQAAAAARQLQQRMDAAKSDEERRQLQQEAARQLQQQMAAAAEKTEQAGGT